ncbi:hypothetical protein [Pseudoduganella armeniaca]|uniref:hypothetical protein n=1 Tax=Pseudoduganella armeniaca TaxID=2072590 RepID=UPI0015E68A46|nr:hypothetical protein [Pseudoduganella armeniaca]
MFRKWMFMLMMAAASCAGAVEPQAEQAAKAATVRQEVLDRYLAAKGELDLLLAPVKSEQALQRYLMQTPAARNPLNALAADTRQEFLDSLTFNETGLTSYNYQVLLDNLTPKQAKAVLALFGSQGDMRYYTQAKRAPAPGVDNSMYCELVPDADDWCGNGDGGGGGWDGGGWGDGPVGGGGGGGGNLGGGRTVYPNMYCESPKRCVSRAGSSCSDRC